MAFNPDDFQFEAIDAPEEYKPILEWNALARLIVVRVKEEGEWKYYASKISTQVNRNLHEHLPDNWSNENDKIVDFSIYEDGRYILEKEKIKYDFSTKKTKLVRYQYEDLEYTEIKELFEILKTVIEVNRLDNEINRTREILDLASTVEYFTQIDEVRQEQKTKLMNASAWSQLADADSQKTFDGELELWTKYRAYLNDNFRMPADFDDILDYLVWDAQFKWPKDPVTYHRDFPDGTLDEYLTQEDHFGEGIAGSGLFATETVYGKVSQVAVQARERQLSGGVPVTKQIWNRVEKYKLNDTLTGLRLENVSIVE